MGVFEGLLGGFQARKSEVEALNLRESELASTREAEVFKALLASPDPEIQALAATGLLESAKPRQRKAGLRGWLGEMQQSPVFPQLQRLIATPVETTPGTLPALGHTRYPTIPTPPPQLGEAPAGTPAQSLTEPGAPPAPRPQPTQIPGKVGTPPTFGPRKVFASPEDTALAQARAKAQGDVEGEVAGLIATGIPAAEARELVKQNYLRRSGALAAQSIAGEVIGPDGTARPEFGIFDRARQGYVYPAGHALAGQPIPGFRPRTTTGSTSMGADREAIARELFGRPFAQLTQPQQAQVNQTAITRTRDVAFQRRMGTGTADIQIQLASPVGPTSARLYNVSPTTTLGELQNVVGLDDTQKERIYAIGQIDLLINDIDQLIPQVFPNVPQGVMGSLQTAFSLGMQKLAGDADLAALDASINAALAQVAQLSGQPGSRLSDRDIEIARSTLASLQPSLYGGDTISTAKARVQVIKNLLEKARTSIPTTPQVGAPPPAAAQTPSVATPGRGGPTRAGAPPPARGRQSGPAGVFVTPSGDLVYR